MKTDRFMSGDILSALLARSQPSLVEDGAFCLYKDNLLLIDDSKPSSLVSEDPPVRESDHSRNSLIEGTCLTTDEEN